MSPGPFPAPSPRCSIFLVFKRYFKSISPEALGTCVNRNQEHLKTIILMLITSIIHCATAKGRELRPRRCVGTSARIALIACSLLHACCSHPASTATGERVGAAARRMRVTMMRDVKVRSLLIPGDRQYGWRAPVAERFSSVAMPSVADAKHFFISARFLALV